MSDDNEYRYDVDDVPIDPGPFTVPDDDVPLPHPLVFLNAHARALTRFDAPDKYRRRLILGLFCAGLIGTVAYIGTFSYLTGIGDAAVLMIAWPVYLAAFLLCIWYGKRRRVLGWPFQSVDPPVE